MNEVTVEQLLFTLEVDNDLAEGIQWHEQTQSIWWTDIQSACLYAYSTIRKTTQIFQMPERVGSFAFCAEQNTFSNKLIVAFASGIALYCIVKKELIWLTDPNEQPLGHRFNDGRVDRQGRFWAGTMIEDDISSPFLSYASLFSIDQSRKCVSRLSGLTISNGLCWSPDSRWLYHADSPKREINRFKYHPETAALSDKTLFAKTDESIYPDGSCVDTDGYIWNAQWGGARIVRYSPQGRIDLVHKLPVTQPSCVAIGGKNMDWLMITTAKQGLSSDELTVQPLAGSIFVYQLSHSCGLPEEQYLG